VDAQTDIYPYEMFVLLEELQTERFTGTATLAADGGQTVLYLSKGGVRYARTTRVLSTFPAYLLTERVFPKHKIKEYLKHCTEAGVSLEKYLLAEQGLQPEDLRHLKRDLARSIFARTFCVSGTVELKPVGRPGHEFRQPPLDPFAALFRCISEHPDRRAMSRALEDYGDQRLRRGPDFFSLLPLFRRYFGRTQLVGLLDEEPSIDEIREAMGQKGAIVSEVFGMHLSGMIHFESEEARRSPLRREQGHTDPRAFVEGRMQDRRQPGTNPGAPGTGRIETGEYEGEFGELTPGAMELTPGTEVTPAPAALAERTPAMGAHGGARRQFTPPPSEVTPAALAAGAVEMTPIPRVARASSARRRVDEVTDPGVGTFRSPQPRSHPGMVFVGEPSRPGVESSRPGIDSFREASRPGVERSRPGIAAFNEPSRPGADGGRATFERTRPATDPPREAGRPVLERSRPSIERSRPGIERSRPGIDIRREPSQAGVERSRPGIETGREVSQPGIEPGRGGFERSQQGTNPGRPAATQPRFSDPTPPPPAAVDAGGNLRDILVGESLIGAADQAERQDFYAFFSIAPGAPFSQLRAAYLEAWSQYGGLRFQDYQLNAEGVAALERLQRHVELAYETLTDPALRRQHNERFRLDADVTGERLDAMFAAEALFNQAQEALGASDNAAALELLSRAAALNGDEPEYLAYLAWAVTCASMWGEVVPEGLAAPADLLNQAVKSDPRLESAWIFRARIAELTGDSRAALSAFAQALAINSENDEARQAVDRLQAAGVEPAPAATAPLDDRLGNIIGRGE
jgi:hypothetical protein